jgi:P-type Cu+ transporter
VKDPVCGMDVTPESAAAAWEHDGTVYYFCSLGCLENFKADPEYYLGLDDAQRRM